MKAFFRAPFYWFLRAFKLIRISSFSQLLLFLLSGQLLKSVIFGHGFVCLGRKNLKIGRNVEFGDNVRIQAEGSEIGEYSYVGHCNFIYGKVQIGKYFMSGPNVAVIGGNHGYDLSETPMSLQPTSVKGILIGDDVWIGSNSVIVDGVSISSGIVVGAGSVVTKNLNKINGIYCGNPARFMKYRQ